MEDFTESRKNLCIAVSVIKRAIDAVADLINLMICLIKKRGKMRLYCQARH
jgi:hypothetical protein